jgi:Zn-dependent peptidase ImmA (M78 family)
MKRGFKTWAENEALRLRGELHLPSDAPLEGRELAKHLRVPIATPADIGVDAETLQELLVGSASRWSAVTLYLHNTPFVVFNPTHSEQRQESDLMHEFAHILCKHPPQRIVAKGLFPFPIREYNVEQEEEADWLGATLKLPRDLLMRALKKGFSDEQLADQFKCSVPLARMRRNRSGVQIQLQRLSAWKANNGWR